MIYIVDDLANTYNGMPTISMHTMLDYFKNAVEIGFDTETTGFDPHSSTILLYQLGDEENQFVVNALYYPLEEIRLLIQDIDKTFIMHNASFDCAFLYHHGIKHVNVWDTFLGEAVINKGDPSIRKSLAETVYRYCQVTLDKSARGLIHKEALSERVLRYAADDVKYLKAVKRNQEQILKAKELTRSMDLENKFVKVLTYVKYSGIKLDRDKWIAKCNEDKDELLRLEKELDHWMEVNGPNKYIDTQMSLDIFGDQRKCLINWSSSKQVIELFKELGIPVVNKEGKDTADVRHVSKYQQDFPILPIYIEYKKLDKLVSTYGEEVLRNVNSVTGRIHTSFKQVMKTGRISSGDKSNAKYSINLQNLPADKRHRECFKAEDNNVFINADYSQQEAVVFANKTKDPSLIAFFKEGLGDMHSYIASKLYPELTDLPLSEIKKKYPELRQKAKAAGFALQYGGNGTTIAENLNLTKEEGDNIYEAYFEAFPQVKEYFTQVANRSFENGYVLINNVTKSKCFIFQFSEYKRLRTRINNPNFWNQYNTEKMKDSITYRNILKPMVTKFFGMKGQIERMAYNYPIQGTAAEMTKVAAIYLFNYILHNNLFNIVKIVNLVHDEIIIECPEMLSDKIAQVTEEYMVKAGDIFCDEIPVKANPVISNHWEH